MDEMQLFLICPCKKNVYIVNSLTLSVNTTGDTNTTKIAIPSCYAGSSKLNPMINFKRKKYVVVKFITIRNTI